MGRTDAARLGAGERWETVCQREFKGWSHWQCCDGNVLRKFNSRLSAPLPDSDDSHSTHCQSTSNPLRVRSFVPVPPYTPPRAPVFLFPVPLCSPAQLSLQTLLLLSDVQGRAQARVPGPTLPYPALKSPALSQGSRRARARAST